MSRSNTSECTKLTPATASSNAKRTTITKTEPTTTNTQSRPKVRNNGSKYHLNTIWSIWYCVVTVFFTCYLVYCGIRRFLLYASLPWPNEEPYMELNAHVGLVGAAVVVMPFFILSAVLKIGNLPNDGFKLGSTLSTCSRDPPAALQPTTGIIRNLWLHGVPTSPFLHLIAAFCLLLPQTLMGAVLIRARFLSSGEVWRSDLDAFIPYELNSLHMIPALNQSDVPSFNPSDDVMMVRIQGTGKTPVESRPFSEIAGSSWRPKRAAYPSYPGNFYSPSNHAGLPLSAQVKDRNENSGKKEEGPLSVFSPHQGKINEVIHTEGNIISSSFSSSLSSSLPSAPPKPQKASRDLFQLDWKPFSPELINYAFALLIFAIRYPSVFWHTNKRFSFLFSFFLILTAIETIIVIVAFSILYKYQVNISYMHSDNKDDFLSSPLSSLMICILSVLTLTVSSSVLYFYGYQRFATFLDKSRKRFHIMYSNTPLVMRPYTARLSALATFLLFGFSLGPLLWDFTILYRKSDGNKIVLTAIVSTIFYLSIWVLLWIILSIKSSWVFKLRVTVARAFVSSARSIKLVNDVEMSQNESENSLAPILIVGSGRAVAIRDPVPKKTIMGLVNKIKEEKKLKGQEEEIYWLKPTFNSSFDRKKLAAKNQAKVTFNDSVEEKFSSRKSLKDLSPTDDEFDEDEAGDYAILKDSYQSFRDNSEVSRSSDSEVSQQSPVLEDPRYVDRKQILAYQKEMKSSSSTDSSPVLVAPDYEETDHFDNSFPGPPTRHNILMDTQGSMTPKSTRSNDSGVPLETPSHRSDSLSSDSSNSNTPPENSEESGIHSAALDIPRNSDEDLSQLPHDIHQSLLNRGSRFSANKATGQTTAEATVAIRRQRNMTQEIRPPADPIYGTRKITSFSPSEPNSPAPSPVPPMPPLPSLEETGVMGLFPPRHTPGHMRVNFQQPETLYGQRVNQTHSKYQQMPLPPIPQGMMPPPSMELLHSNTYGNIESSQHHQPQNYQQMGPNGVYGYTRNISVGRSASLRYPSTHVGVPKQYTNTLPHVLPKESQYNTNV